MSCPTCEDFLLNRQSDPVLPFSFFDPAAITTEVNAVSSCHNSEIPSLFVSCRPMTSQPFAAQILKRTSIWPIPLTPLKADVRTLNVPNVSSCVRLFALAAMCFIRAAFLIACFLRRFFRTSALRLSLSTYCSMRDHLLEKLRASPKTIRTHV